LLFIAAALPAQTPEQKKATVKFLQELQVEDGGFVPVPIDSRVDKAPRGSLRATSAGLRALKYFGGEPKDRKAAAKFVQSCWAARTGAFSEQGGGIPDVFSTAVGLMAVAELGLPMADYRDDAVKFLGENAKEFEDIRIAAAGMEAAGTRAGQVERWYRHLQGKANPDGSFGKGAEVARATGGRVVAIPGLDVKVEPPAPVIDILNNSQSNVGVFGKC